MYNTLRENVKSTHEQWVDSMSIKMQKLKLGLKSYRYFDQAKELAADKLGVALNEGILELKVAVWLCLFIVRKI